MKPLLRHASKSSIQYLSISTASYLAPRPGLVRQVDNPWVCQQCRHQSRSLGRASTPYQKWAHGGRNPTIRPERAQIDYYNHRYASLSRQDRPSSGDVSSVSKAFQTELPSQEEGRRSHVSKRFTHLMDHLQSNIFIAGQRLNDLTGYSGIEALKKDIEEQGKIYTPLRLGILIIPPEELVRTTRSDVQKAKEAYTSAIAQRSASQREVNELLQRKHAWSGQDLERFTSLYRSDHANEQAEAATQEALATAERKAEEAAANLSASILARYHEEQIWSDKIRRMSTWGTWGLMGVNVLLFLVFQIGVEPWRRKRLVKGFEEKVMEALEREGAATNAATGAALAALQASQKSLPVEPVEEEVAEPPVVTSEVMAAVDGLEPVEPVTDAAPTSITISNESEEFKADNVVTAILSDIRRYIEDLFSERQIPMSRKDLTTATLEGVLYGIAITSVITALLRGR